MPSPPPDVQSLLADVPDATWDRLIEALRMVPRAPRVESPWWHSLPPDELKEMTEDT